MGSPELVFETPIQKVLKLSFRMKLALGKWEKIELDNEKVSFFRATEVEKELCHWNMFRARNDSRNYAAGPGPGAFQSAKEIFVVQIVFLLD